MKKIIASLTSEKEYEIATNAARAPFFIVFEDDSYVKTIKNPFTSGGGAGFAVAELLKDEGCNLFIAGKLGDNLKERLESYWIDFEESE